MMKRAAATGLLAAAFGGVVLSASPAMADPEPATVQIVGGQTCRALDGAGLGAAVHNAVGVDLEGGHCLNGSTAG